jgi:hypothetical protein
MFNSKQELTMAKATKHADSAAGKIRMYLRANPTATPKKVAEVFNVTAQYISVIKHNMKKAGEKVVPLKADKPKRPAPQKWKTLHIGTSDNSIEAVMEKELPVTMETSALDVQVAGSHYKDKPIQPVEYISANKLNFLEGCVVKRITRWREKPVEKQFDDLYKIKHEIDLLIEMESKYPKRS